MEYLQYTEFRNQAKKYFDQIEQGARFTIIRKGKPVAEILPFNKKIPGWKRPVKKARLKGSLTTTDILRRERDES